MSTSAIHNTLMKAGLWIALGLLIGCVGRGGTIIPLRTNQLSPPPHPVQERVALLNEADDSYPSSPAIGEATWTLFRMHLAGITADPPPKTEMIALAKSALEKAGYEVKLVEAREATSRSYPIVYMKIDEFAYEMWSWTWPYVPISGGTAITVALKASDGRQIDSRVFRAQGKETCWFGGCTRQVEAAVAQSLTSIMNQLIGWASEQSFRKAVAPSPLQHAKP